MKRLFVKVLTFVATTLNRLLVTLSLTAAVACTALFIYGLFFNHYRLCIVCSIGAVVFVWVNKQT